MKICSVGGFRVCVRTRWVDILEIIGVETMKTNDEVSRVAT